MNKKSKWNEDFAESLAPAWYDLEEADPISDAFHELKRTVATNPEDFSDEVVQHWNKKDHELLKAFAEFVKDSTVIIDEKLKETNISMASQTAWSGCISRPDLTAECDLGIPDINKKGAAQHSMIITVRKYFKRFGVPHHPVQGVASFFFAYKMPVTIFCRRLDHFHRQGLVLEDLEAHLATPRGQESLTCGATRAVTLKPGDLAFVPSGYQPQVLFRSGEKDAKDTEWAHVLVFPVFHAPWHKKLSEELRTLVASPIEVFLKSMAPKEKMYKEQLATWEAFAKKCAS